MSLDPRAIAAQGLGSSVRLVALQGLWPVSDQPPVDIFPGPGVRQAPAKPRRRDRDDDALIFLLR